VVGVPFAAKVPYSLDARSWKARNAKQDAENHAAGSRSRRTAATFLGRSFGVSGGKCQFGGVRPRVHAIGVSPSGGYPRKIPCLEPIGSGGRQGDDRLGAIAMNERARFRLWTVWTTTSCRGRARAGPSGLRLAPYVLSRQFRLRVSRGGGDVQSLETHGKRRRQYTGTFDAERLGPLGNEQPLSVDARRMARSTAAGFSVQWFSGTILTGLLRRCPDGVAPFFLAALDGSKNQFRDRPGTGRSRIARARWAAWRITWSPCARANRLPPCPAKSQHPTAKVSFASAPTTHVVATGNLVFAFVHSVRVCRQIWPCR